MMFGIGVPELILILIIGLVVFGPGKLPEVGRAVGKSLNEFKKATSGIIDSASTSANAQKAQVKTETVKEEPAKAEAAKDEPAKPEVK